MDQAYVFLGMMAGLVMIVAVLFRKKIAFKFESILGKATVEAEGHAPPDAGAAAPADAVRHVMSSGDGSMAIGGNAHKPKIDNRRNR